MNTTMNDQLSMISSQRAQELAFRVIHTLQDQPSGHQVAAIAMTFLLLCQRYEAKPRDVLNKTSRILYDAFSEGRGEHARAIANYMKEELR